MARRRRFRRTQRTHRPGIGSRAKRSGASSATAWRSAASCDGRGVAIVRLGGQAAAHHRLQGRRHVGMGRAQPGRAAAPGLRRAEQGLGHRQGSRGQRERSARPSPGSRRGRRPGHRDRSGCRPSSTRPRPAPPGARAPCRRGSRRPRRARPRRGRSRGSCARLKSSSIGRPSPVTRTFEGLTSRCKTWRSWACCSASAIRAPHQAIAWA